MGELWVSFVSIWWKSTALFPSTTYPRILVPFSSTRSQPPNSIHNTAFLMYSWPWIVGARDLLSVSKTSYKTKYSVKKYEIWITHPCLNFKTSTRPSNFPLTIWQIGHSLWQMDELLFPPPYLQIKIGRKNFHQRWHNVSQAILNEAVCLQHTNF